MRSMRYLLCLLLAIAIGTSIQLALNGYAVAQQLTDPGPRAEPPYSNVGRRTVPISRTPEGFTLGRRTSEIFEHARERWGSDYMAVQVWDRYWYPYGRRTVSGRFTQRRCGKALAYAPICEGTILRSTSASNIEIVAFQGRVFRISVTLPEVPDYRLQSQNMMNVLRQKYGPPSPGSRWQDGETELVFSEIGPAWPAVLHYSDVRGTEQVERAAQEFAEAEAARIKARSLRTPRGY